MPQDSRGKNAQREKDSVTFHPGTFSPDTKEMKEPWSCTICVLPRQQMKKEKVERFKRTGKGLKRHTSTSGGKSCNICFLVSKEKNHLKEYLGIKQTPFTSKTPSTVYQFMVLFPKGS